MQNYRIATYQQIANFSIKASLQKVLKICVDKLAIAVGVPACRKSLSVEARWIVQVVAKRHTIEIGGG